MANKNYTENALAKQAAAAKQLLIDISSDDEELNHDMIEGETSLLEAVDRAVEIIDEAEMIMIGCKAKEKALADRRKAAETRKEKLRALITQAMLVTELPQLRLATGVFSTKELAPSALIEDEEKIPTKYWRTPDPVLDRAKIKKDFEDGVKIPGVTKTNGSISLAFRRS